MNRWKPAAWLLVLGVLWLYFPALDGQILDWDDEVWVLDPIVQSSGVEAVRLAFTTVHDRAWYPLLRLSWWMQHAVFGPDPWWMHAVNLGLFGASILLAVRLLERLGLSPAVALTAVALWALHPTRVESVAWMTSRKDLLSLVAILLAAHAFVAGRAAVATVAFGVACLCKAAVFPLAGVFALLAWARRTPVADASGILGLGAGVAVFGGVAYGTGTVTYPFEGIERLGFLLGLQGAWWKRLLDVGALAAIQPLPVEVWTSWVGGLLCLGGASALAWRQQRWGAVLLGLWLLPLFPVHGAVPMPFWGADRHLLLPSLAIATALAWAAPRWWMPWILVPPLAWVTAGRIPEWHDSLALWSAESTRSGEHWVRDLKLGTALGRASRFEEAVVAFRRAEALEPGRSDLLARRLLAEMAADGWTQQDGQLARGLQPPPATGEQWAQLTRALVALGHPSACDAGAQAVTMGASMPEVCRPR